MSYNRAEILSKQSERREARRPAPKDKKPVKKISDKRKELNKEYKKISHEFLRDKPFCQVNSPDCTKVTEGVHHKKGKIGELLTNPDFFIASCNACNLWIEVNDKEARKLGLKLSKHG